MTPGAHTPARDLMSMMDEQPQALPISQIQVIPGFNPRAPLPGDPDPFAAEALSTMVESIKEQGVLQPLLVRPAARGYELIAGERRYHAAQMAGLREVPVLIRDLSDAQARRAALTENGQRENVPYAQEARMGLREIAHLVGCQLSEVPALLNRLKNGEPDQFGVADFLRRCYGESVSTWAQRRALVLKLTPAELRALDEAQVNTDALRLLTKVNDTDRRSALLTRLVEGSVDLETLKGEVGQQRRAAVTQDPLNTLRQRWPQMKKLGQADQRRAQELMEELLKLLGRS